MIVHFIGGPAHGRSEAIKNPHTTYRVAELKRLPAFAALEFEGDFSAAAAGPVEEHEYRITRRTRRYCIAEWQPPKVKVQVSVAFTGLAFWDQGVHEKLMKFVYEEHDKPPFPGPGGGLQMERHHYGTGVLTVEWAVTVDGPADPEAIAEAMEVVQHRIDVGVGFLPERFSTIAAQVVSD